jgi:FAD/FMN-containing dehydrogenase
MTMLSGWGRTPWVMGHERLSEDLASACRDAALTRGLGRSYGDASLPARSGGIVAGSRRADCVLAFDRVRGVLRAEAGMSLSDLTELVRPLGWSCPVVPGTGQVTLGGMVAADVHGKNHHVAGTLGQHVTGLLLLVADGRELVVGPTDEPELFDATLGGMGLTGHILEVELQLQAIPSPWIRLEEQPVADLEALLGALRAASDSWPYTVAWVDALATGAALGRGVVMKGRWAETDELVTALPRPPRERTLPFEPPEWALGRTSVGLFDACYYHAHRLRPRRGIVHPDAFFHPLDALHDWNRLYGRRGFVQHQCMLPGDDVADTVRRLLTALVARNGSSFLTVIKDCGAEGRGLLSFPCAGVSVALDLPMRGAATQALIDELNEIVIAASGRIYLAKDALTRPEHFAAMEPRVAAWNTVRRAWDPDGKLKSALSVRLLGDSP